MEHYFRNKHKSFLGLIMPVLGMLFIGAGIFLGALYVFYDVVKFEMFASIVISLLLTVLITIFFIYRIINGPDYIVTDKAVIFKKRNKIIHEFQYKDYVLSSYVIRQSYNGIPTGSMRHLIVDNGKKEKKYMCALSKKNFDEFMSLINTYSGNFDTNNIKEETINILSEVNKDFYLDKNRIFRDIALKKYLGLIFISFMLLVMFFILSYFDGNTAWYMLIWVIASLLLYFGVVFFSVWNTKRKIPEKIRIRTNEIYFDEENFNYNEVAKISLTPSSYYVGSINRVLKIQKTDGKKKTYILGFKVAKAGKKDKIFPEYEEFSYMLEGILGNSPGKFQYDL